MSDADDLLAALAADEPNLGDRTGEDVALDYAALLCTVEDASLANMAQALLASNLIIARRLGRIEVLLGSERAALVAELTEALDLDAGVADALKRAGLTPPESPDG